MSTESKRQTVSKDVRHRIVRSYLKTPEGRRRLAVSMVQPIRMRLAYVALYSKMLRPGKVPFCEPLVVEEEFEVDDWEALERGMGLARAHILRKADMALVAGLEGIEWNSCSFRDLENHPEHKRFAEQEGTCLMNARTYADIRHHWPSVQWAGLVTTGEPPEAYGNMLFQMSRHVESGQIFLVPKEVGRFCDTFDAQALDEPGEEGHPAFRIRHKLCLEVDPSEVRAIKMA